MVSNALKKQKSLVLGVALVILIGVLLFIALRPQPKLADFSKVRRGPLAVTVDEEGETRVRDRFVVSAPLAGKVLRIELEPGDPVVANETVLATFQPNAPVLLDARSRAEGEARVKAARSALGQAKAERERARAELRHAEAELLRYRKLAAEEIVSKEILEEFALRQVTAEEASKAYDYAVSSAEFELERARATLVVSEQQGSGNAVGPMAIRSPVGGVVLRRLRESEAVVPAGEPLLEVADPADLEIVSDLLSSDAVKVAVGQRVQIEQWGGEEPLVGRVRRIEPSGFTKVSALGVEEQRVNVVVDFADPEKAHQYLGDGYRVEVRIVIWETDDVLILPSSSLFRHRGDWAVFAVKEGLADLRTVEVGQRNGLEVEVLGGIEEGTEVIVHPSDSIEDGVRIAAR